MCLVSCSYDLRIEECNKEIRGGRICIYEYAKEQQSYFLPLIIPIPVVLGVFISRVVVDLPGGGKSILSSNGMTMGAVVIHATSYAKPGFLGTEFLL